MSELVSWLGAAGVAYQALAVLFVAALLGLILQFAGLEADDAGADIDGGGAAVFTLRNFTAFALGFSLLTLVTAHATGRDSLAVLAGLVAGAGFVAANMTLLAVLARLGENGTQKLEALVGTIGRVTVPVSEDGHAGKALFVGPDSRAVELPAICSAGALPRGTPVRLVGLPGGVALVATVDER